MMQMSRGDEITKSNTISYDDLSYSYISGIHHRTSEKIFNPNYDPEATDKLLALRNKWLGQNVLTVFSSGVFDLMHMDHMAYLLHVKATGAALHYERQNYNQCWDELTTPQQKEYTNKALGDKAIRLIISIDGDKSVALRKGNNPEKQGVPTPIYSWRTRAMMTAGLSFVDPLDNSGETLIPTVDAITIHGPQDFPEDHLHASEFDLVSKINPDVWTVFGESTDILDVVPYRKDLASIALRCIRDGKGTHYFEDENIGKMSTTKIARRIAGY